MKALVPLLLALAGCDKVWGLERTPDAPTPLVRWDSVAPGGTHTCGIRLDHTLWCWGRNDLGQLGATESFADLESVDPRQVGSDDDWATVASGTFTSCAIKTDQSLWCWGDNRYGQVGTGKNQPIDAPSQVPGAWKLVAPGEVHTCAIGADDSLSCWGYNGRGQLGDGTVADHYSPMPVLGSAKWLDVGTAELSTCGLQVDQTMHCWGTDAYGQLGLDLGAGQIVPMPTEVLGTGTWSKLAVGNLFTCGLLTDGHMRCWGRNDVGQVGDSSGTTRTTPTAVDQDLVSDWTDVVAGREHVCGIRSTGAMLCWGSNEHGQLISDPARAFRGRPTALLDPPDGLVSLALGDRSTCAIDASRQLWCAGYQPHSVRRPVEVGGTWTEVRAANGATCGLQGETLACWGANDHGAVGDGTLLDRQLPVVMAARAWSSVTMGGSTVCALDPVTEISCWGANANAQVGLIDAMAQTDQVLPQSLGNGHSISAATGNHTCVVSNDHSMFCWGYNASGECGPAPNNPQIVLRAYAPPGAWNPVAVGDSHTCAIDYTTGYVMCSGLGASGQCGTGFAGPTSEFRVVVVPGMPGFSSITSGALFTCGLAGTAAWCWGSNARGQLGNQTTVDAGLAIEFPGAWKELSAGHSHVCGIQTDGTLWCSGANAYGQLGDGTLAERHEVVQVGTDTDWVQVAAGQEHTCARKQAGTLYCWGANRSGELGLGTAWRATLEQILH